MWGKTKSRPVATAQFDTLIAQGTVIRGDLEFTGGVHIDGTVHGTLRASDAKDAAVRLSEVSRIEGDVIAPHVIINGKVLGNVYASEHLELAANASITGNVYYNLIEMVMGAEVNGSLVHDREQAEKKLGVSLEKAAEEALNNPESDRFDALANSKRVTRIAESSREKTVSDQNVASVVAGNS